MTLVFTTISAKNSTKMKFFFKARLQMGKPRIFLSHDLRPFNDLSSIVKLLKTFRTDLFE